MKNDTSFEVRIAQLLADPLSAAREAASNGQRVIGYVSAEAPVELILAAGAVPVRLRGLPNAPTPRADKFLENAFHPEMRAVAEQWLSGAFDFIDAVIFPRTNDSAQRLYYYICEFQRRGICGGPTPLLFDIATIERKTSFEHTLTATRALAKQLGSTESALGAAIDRVQLCAMQHPGSVGLRIARAAAFDWTEDFDAAMSAHQFATPSGKRLALAGSSPPDERLHVAVEVAGGAVVWECTETSSPPVAGGELERGHLHAQDAPTPTLPRRPGEGVLETLALRYHHTATPAQLMLSSSTWLVDQARAAQAAGVILWLIEEDEALPWEVAGQVNALKRVGIPVLALTRQRWLADAATLNAIEEFVRDVEGKS